MSADGKLSIHQPYPHKEGGLGAGDAGDEDGEAGNEAGNEAGKAGNEAGEA